MTRRSKRSRGSWDLWRSVHFEMPRNICIFHHSEETQFRVQVYFIVAESVFFPGKIFAKNMCMQLWIIGISVCIVFFRVEWILLTLLLIMFRANEQLIGWISWKVSAILLAGFRGCDLRISTTLCCGGAICVFCPLWLRCICAARCPINIYE